MYDEYAEVKEKYAAVIKDLLTKRFGDEIVFDPIVIRADPDAGPDPEFPSLWAYICYDGDDSKMDSQFRFEFTEELWPHSRQLGFPSVPVQSFVPKANWPQFWPGLKAWIERRIPT